MMFDKKHDKEKKQTSESMVLSYKAAYNRLIQWINEYYWNLDHPVDLDFLDQDLRKDPEIMDSQIYYYIPKKDGAVESSGATGEKRLREFLKEIYMDQVSTPESEGCLPILKAVEKIITGSAGHRLPGILADAVRKRKLDAVFLKPNEKVVILSGDSARQSSALIEHLKTAAEKRCNSYFSKDSHTSEDALVYGM